MTTPPRATPSVLAGPAHRGAGDARPPGRERELTGPRARLRRLLRAHGRDALFYAAIAATMLLVAVAMLETSNRWRSERAAVRRALNDETTDAMVMVVDWVINFRRAADLSLLAPVHGIVSTSEERRLRLDDFDHYATVQLEALGLAGDALHGVFRIDLRERWPTADELEATGAARDPAIARAIIAELAAARARSPVSGQQMAGARLQVDGRTVKALYSHERGPDGAPLAIFGVLYSPTLWIARFTQQVVDSLPLLSPTFYGVDWTTAERVARPDEGQTIKGRPHLRNNRVLAISAVDSLGRDVYRTPGVPADVWTSNPGGPLSGFDGIELRVRLAPAHERRLVEAAAPIGAQQWLLAGIALLGALFVAAAILELRRQHQLAEERRNFVSAITHELRTPLAHMALLSETLLGPVAQTPEQRRRWLSVIHREAIRLGRLVENVLLHTRGEQQHLTLDVRWVDACDMLQEAIASMRPTADARRVHVRVVTPPECPAYVDPGALRQMLLNLLDNALKYGPDGQTVTVTLTSGPVDAPALIIAVDDEGPGIPEPDRRRVWAPFVRLGDRGGATGGSGLGLSVVHALVRQHDGTATIARAEGGGARFVITLPQNNGVRLGVAG
ncbi:MAG TPA: HAMP domain-containing sensor histidine kinase [Gemmatimonadaceae bacterium]|nr:HAMP domain-containing sensor histidine kinase [Gemmatimonadaceae bacterium]